MKRFKLGYFGNLSTLARGYWEFGFHLGICILNPLDFPYFSHHFQVKVENLAEIPEDILLKSHGEVRLQAGTNRFASQKGFVAFGLVIELLQLDGCQTPELFCSVPDVMCAVRESTWASTRPTWRCTFVPFSSFSSPIFLTIHKF